MPQSVLYPEQMREMERVMMEEQGIPGIVLMENAGSAVARFVSDKLEKPSHVLVVCGRGNNGGDGYVCARHLALLGHTVTLWCTAFPKGGQRDARACCQAMIASGIIPACISDGESLELEKGRAGRPDLVVDALFGIGLSRPVQGVEALLIEWMNGCGAPVCAVDLPSGVAGDTGKALGPAVQARWTVTFQAAKIGHMLLPGRAHCGELHVVPLSILREETLEGVHTQWIRPGDLPGALPVRRMEGHKGDYGHGLLIGGSVGYVGAALMAGRAALRSGIGLLSIGTPQSVASALWAGLPGAMTHPLEEAGGRLSQQAMSAFFELMEGKSCFAIGPGLGKTEAALPMIRALCASGKPVVVDADGLNALAGNLDALAGGNAVLTPHPGEMARLCGRSVGQVLENPVECASDLAMRLGVVVLLKGATTVIADPDGNVTFNTAGTPGLSKGGSGDVLTGIILALLGQGMSCYDGARYGALIMGRAAETVGKPATCVVAGDVIEALCQIFAG